MKGKITKRIISFSLSVLLILGLAIGHLPGGIFYEWIMAASYDFSLEQSELALGANVIPNQLKNNAGFISKYIYTTNSDALNLNSNFKLSSWKNIDSDISMNIGNTLTRSKLMHQKNKGWEANYVWSDMTDAQVDLIQNRDYVLVYEGDLFADYHYNVFINANKHWDVGTATLFRGTVDLDYPGYAVKVLKAEEKDDEKSQAVSTEIDYIPMRPYVNSLTFRAEHEGCSCGSSAVSNSIIYMYDKSLPYVENVYVCSNSDGTGKLSSGDGFDANETGYVVLDFNEDVRFSDNKGERLTLNLDAYYCENNTSVEDSVIYAELISLKDDKLIFEFTVPEKTGNKLTNVYINGISSQQEFVDSSSEYPLILYKGDGSIAIDINGGYTVNNYITDLAGNPMDWSIGNKSFGKIYLDNVNPTLTGISMSGSMINQTSTISKDSWPADIDRGSVFAGVGDTIAYTVDFSESITGYTKSEVKAILNIKGADGNYIELGLDRDWSDSFKFQSLTITADMVANNYGKPIVIIGFKGLENLKDKFGNEMEDSLTSISKAPAQQIYLDVDAPVISTPMTLNAGETVYTPYADAEGEYFTFPIKIAENLSKTTIDNTSTITGKVAYFSLLMNGNNNFEWYIDTNQTIDKNATWNSGTTASTAVAAEKNSFTLVDGTIYYIHIKLDKNTDYNYVENLSDKGVNFVGSIYVSAEDYAGNKSNATYAIEHQVDKVSPTGSVSANTNLSVDYTTLTGKLTADLEVKDNYAVKSIQYYWTYTPYVLDGSGNLIKGTTKTQVPQTVTIESGMFKGNSSTVSYSFEFKGDNNTGRKGEAYLTIEFEDYSGRSGKVVGETYAYDFTKSIPNYTIKTGSKEIPLLLPEIVISAPISTEGSSLAESTRTILAIPYGTTTEDGTTYTNYYIWDPYDHNSISNDLEYTAEDIIAELENYYKNGSAYSGAWSKVTGNFTLKNGGTIQADNVVESFNPKPVYEYIANTYGEIEILIITSSDFSKSHTSLTSGTGYAYTSANSDVAVYTVYMDNNAEFEVKLTDIQKDGKDATDALNYVAGNVPAQNIDNVALTFTIENITGKTDATPADVPGYDLIPLDIANCKAVLYYCGGSNTYTGTAIYTWALDKVNTQTLVIPEGVAINTGWYRVEVTLCNVNGTSATAKMENYFFMDTHVSDVQIHEYYKAYDHEDLYTYTTENKLIPKNHTDLEGCTYLDVALDTAPEGWTLDTYITFGRTDRTDETNYGITELVKVRVYNKADVNYEENAIWIDLAGMNAEARVSYMPVEVSEFAQKSYGTSAALQLPLLPGENLICYEIMSTNGIVTSHEIAMYAYTEAVDLELDVEYTKISSRTGGLMEFTVSPVETPELELSNSIFNFLVVTHAEPNATIFTFDYDINKEFYLLDQNGNLSTTHCVVTDVDGDAPYGSSRVNTYGTGNTFYMEVDLHDHEGVLDASELVLTFDAYYSGLLMGLTGAARTNNTEQISIKVPLNTQKDAQGEYIPWESYSGEYYGIYRTQLYNYGTDESHVGNLSFKIWGDWKTEPVDENGEYLNEVRDRVLTFSIPDANGNELELTRSFSVYGTGAPSVSGGAYVRDEDYVDKEVYTLNYDEKLDENGYVGIYFDRPLQDVNGYGAGKVIEVKHNYYGYTHYYTTAPMITKDGIYKFEVTDLFGDIYETSLTVNVFDTLGIDVSFSETKETNQDVTLTAEAVLENDYITSITAITDSGKTITGTIIKGEDMLPTTAIITMPENGLITIETEQGNKRVVTVSNIDKELEAASVIFVDSMGMEINPNADTLYEKVTAMVVCDEVLYGINGQLNHTFSIGSVKGDTYTFEYSDVAGNTGSITAALPYNLENHPAAEPVVDDKTPDIMLGLYGMRDNTYNWICDVANPCDEVLENGTLDNSDSVLIGDALGVYISQKYKLMLDIEDDSDVKILVKEANSSAPTFYDAVETGSLVEHVTVSGTAIIVEENTAFDIYVIDEMNNVTSLTNVVVDSIDNIAVDVEATYEVTENENGETVVVATFEPKNPQEALAQIIALNESVLSKWMLVDIYDETLGEVIQKTVLRYYYLLSENGSYDFTYKDEYGNVGQSTATVKGLNNSPAVVNSVSWFGTIANKTPDKSSMVNKDVVAAMKMSKTISDVKLYVYQQGNSSALDETYLGAALDANTPVKLSFTNNNVYITYEENVDYQIIAQFTATENGKKGYYVLPAVTCIDKVAPTVTLVRSEVSEDKRSMTFIFETSEATLFSKNNTTEYETTFEWTAVTNRAQELIFTDKAGNIVRYQITKDMLSNVDTRYMSVSFSASANGANATKEPAKDLNIAIGGDIYVKASKEAVAYVNDVNVGIFAADTWTKVTLPQQAGLHILKLVDVNTNEILYKTIAAQPKDNVAPVITFDLNTIALEESATVAELDASIHSGVTIADDKDGVITEYTVTGQPSTVKKGLYELTYTAQDEAGNKVVANRTLYIMQEGTPVVKINGETAVPYGTTIIRDFDIKLEVKGLDTDLLTVKVKSGIKTVGQMKYGTTTVENMQFTVSEEGFYTIYIRTQDRVELITHIYVEE